MRQVVVFTTVIALLLHVALGCCWHHAHAAESGAHDDCHAKVSLPCVAGLVQDHVACGEEFAEHLVENPAGPLSGDCHQSQCCFLPATRLIFDSRDVSLSWGDKVAVELTAVTLRLSRAPGLLKVPGQICGWDCAPSAQLLFGVWLN